MCEKDLLNIDGDFELYINLYNNLYDIKNEDDKPYIPHNINYLCKEEQEKYNDIQEKYKDEIDDFINNKNKNKTTYPSLKDVLDDISDDSSNENTSDDEILNIIDGNFDDFENDNSFEECDECENLDDCCNCELNNENNENNKIIDTIVDQMNTIKLNN
jgi:hypothetical protein